MRDHTGSDSFIGFCEQSPRESSDIDGTRDISRDRLNEYIIATIDFEAREGMKTQVTGEEIID